MRVKDPSKDLPEKGKRSKRPLLPHDEDSSDDIAGKWVKEVTIDAFQFMDSVLYNSPFSA